jgi:hypothetical protein
MLIDNEKVSVLASDPFKVQAAELLVHLLSNQELVALASMTGAEAGGYCSDFIDTVANRLRAMTKSKAA